MPKSHDKHLWLIELNAKAVSMPLYFFLCLILSACANQYNTATMECYSDNDCLSGQSCRSKKGGGSECRGSAISLARTSECQSESDCAYGQSCRSKKGGGTECRASSESKNYNPPKPPPPPPSSRDNAPQITSTGTSVMIAKDLFITNAHVINGCIKIDISGFEAKVKASDSENDLAILEASVNGRYAKLRSQRPMLGEQVVVAGYPLQSLLSGLNVTTGVISGLSGIKGDSRFLQITAPVQSGNSGGPLFDQSGNLAGIIVSKLDAIKIFKTYGDVPQNINFAINVNVLRSFLDAKFITYDIASNEKILSPQIIADKAKDSTFMVRCWE